MLEPDNLSGEKIFQSNIYSIIQKFYAIKYYYCSICKKC